MNVEQVLQIHDQEDDQDVVDRPSGMPLNLIPHFLRHIVLANIR